VSIGRQHQLNRLRVARLDGQPSFHQMPAQSLEEHMRDSGWQAGFVRCCLSQTLGGHSQLNRLTGGTRLATAGRDLQRAQPHPQAGACWPQTVSLQQIAVPHEGRHTGGLRLATQLLRAGDLLDATLVQDGDSVGQA
jgi:hypothetical protein